MLNIHVVWMFGLLSLVCAIPNAKNLADSQIFFDEVLNDKPGRNASKIRPIIFMHGILNNPDEPDFASQYISEKVPGAIVYPIDLWNGFESAYNLYSQLDTILPAMQKIMDNHADTGVTLLCYSQGGVICRSAVQMLSTHNVHTMITLSSPLDGQYGITSYISYFLPTKDRRWLWKDLYTTEGQYWLSVANYWNDPHHQDVFADPKLNVLTARLNNQFKHNDSTAYRTNFMRLEKLVMVGGPNDTVITPWQSAHMGFYDQNEIVNPFEKQPWYPGDDFGLRTLNEANKVVRHTYPGVHHTHWYRTPAVFDCCVIPYLT